MSLKKPQTNTYSSPPLYAKYTGQEFPENIRFRQNHIVLYVLGGWYEKRQTFYLNKNWNQQATAECCYYVMDDSQTTVYLLCCITKAQLNTYNTIRHTPTDSHKKHLGGYDRKLKFLYQQSLPKSNDFEYYPHPTRTYIFHPLHAEIYMVKITSSHAIYIGFVCTTVHLHCLFMCQKYIF